MTDKEIQDAAKELLQQKYDAKMALMRAIDEYVAKTHTIRGELFDLLYEAKENNTNIGLAVGIAQEYNSVSKVSAIENAFKNILYAM